MIAYPGSLVRAAESAALAAAGHAGVPDRHMRAAAHGLAVAVLRHLAGRGVYGAPLVALVGPGGNGGDGLFALAELARRGASVTAVCVDRRRHAAGEEALRAAGGRVLEAGDPRIPAALGSARVVLDAVLGTGARADTATPAWAGLYEHVPDDAWRVACDAPSGVDSDTGEAPAHVPWAHATVTMGVLKTGLILGRGGELSGEVEVVELPGLLDAAVLADAAANAPGVGSGAVRVVGERDAYDSVLSPGKGDHKYSRGVLGLLAGSPAYPGAAVLSARAAIATGVGMLSAFSRGTARLTLGRAVPEAVVSARGQAPDGAPARRVSAWAVGPGLGEARKDLDAAARVLATDAPAVVDASALAVVEALAPGGPARLLTPHAGELRALSERLGLGLPDPAARPLAAVTGAARALGAVVLLKGATTLVAAPAGSVFAARSAGPELAVAGSGDTLTGIAGALLATHTARAGRAPSGTELARLGAAAAVLHGLAGRHAPAAGAGALADGLTAALRGVG